jgi:histidinol-phosphate aminotransferase
MSVETSKPVPRPGILDIAAYVPGKEHAPGVATRLQALLERDAARASPKAIEAFRAAAGNLERYPDGQASSCARRSPPCMVSTRLTSCAATAPTSCSACSATSISAPGDEAIITEHGFLVYKIQIMGAGATPVTSRKNDATVDVDAILAAVTPKTKMVFIANPGNPTGTYVPSARSAACRPACRRM